MKKTHFMALKTVLGVAMIALVVTVAHAWTAPSGTAPSGNVPVPINTGATGQTKTGFINTLSSLSASDYVLSLKFLFAPMAVLGCNGGIACVLNAQNTLNQDVLRAGSFNTSGYLTQGARVSKDGNVALGKITTGQLLPSKGLFVGTLLGQDFVSSLGKFNIGLSSATGSAGRNALEVTVSNDNATGGDGAVLQTNADRFSFYNTLGQLIGITAKRIRLTEGAAQGKVLTSDANGNASWGDAAGGDGYEFPFPIYTQAINADDLVTASCPPAYPIMLSAGGRCSSPAQIQEMYVSFVGNPTSPGNMQMRCTKADLGGSSKGITAEARPVCAKPSNWTYQTPPAQYQPTWHTTLPEGPMNPAAGTVGQSCYSWLDGMVSTYVPSPNGPQSGLTMRATGGNSPTGNYANGYCAYKGDVFQPDGSTVTYCGYRPANTQNGFQVPGTNTTIQLTPVATCTGLDLITGVSETYTTEIKW